MIKDAAASPHPVRSGRVDGLKGTRIVVRFPVHPDEAPAAGATIPGLAAGTVGRLGLGGGEHTLSLSAVIGGSEPSLGAIMAEVRLLEFPPMEDAWPQGHSGTFDRRRASRVMMAPGEYIPLALTRGGARIADGQLVDLSHSGLAVAFQRRPVTSGLQQKVQGSGQP